MWSFLLWTIIFISVSSELTTHSKAKAPLLGSYGLLNIIMRYQLLDDELGNFLIIDTWANQLLAKVTTLELGARICQNLNKRLGTQAYLDELRQKHLTNCS